MNLMSIINFLIVSGLGVIIGGFLWKYIGDYTKKTETKIDDEIYEDLNELIPKALDEVELGKYEEFIRKVLKTAEQMDKDTSKVEEHLNKEMEKIKK